MPRRTGVVRLRRTFPILEHPIAFALRGRGELTDNAKRVIQKFLWAALNELSKLSLKYRNDRHGKYLTLEDVAAAYKDLDPRFALSPDHDEALLQKLNHLIGNPSANYTLSRYYRLLMSLDEAGRKHPADEYTRQKDALLLIRLYILELADQIIGEAFEEAGNPPILHKDDVKRVLE